MPSKTYIGFDIGATHTRAVVWRSEKTLKVIKIKTPRTKKAFSVVIGKIVDTNAPAAVSISIAGVIEGMKLSVSPNEPALSGLDLRAIVPKRFPLVVDNDARAFAYGEYKGGAGRGAKRLLAFTIGTGVGRAFVVNGKLQKIKSFERAEKWEKEYQREWNKMLLAKLLATRLQPIISNYRPDRIVIGGGVALNQRFRFFNMLKKELQKQNPRISIRPTKLGEFAAAYGMIFKL